MNIQIRRAHLQDAQAIHTAHMKSIQEVCSKDHSPEEIQAWGHRPYREDQRHSAITDDLVWVVEDSGSIEGYGHFKIFEKDGLKKGHILGLYLTQKVLGKKLGKSIVHLMLAEARSARVKEITLEATLTAHDFYQKVGFQDNGPQSFLEINGHNIRCHRMSMILS
jgi:N-acetylglutamate synthase-like GNAT family acetyltransferase